MLIIKRSMFGYYKVYDVVICFGVHKAVYRCMASMKAIQRYARITNDIIIKRS
jgi:hypothetical protein